MSDKQITELTKEEKEKFLLDYHEGLQFLEQQIGYASVKLGRNHDGVKKLGRIYDILESFSETEMLELAQVIDDPNRED